MFVSAAIGWVPAAKERGLAGYAGPRRRELSREAPGLELMYSGNSVESLHVPICILLWLLRIHRQLVRRLAVPRAVSGANMEAFIA